MADTKLSALPSATPVATDEMYFLDDPAGSALDRNTTVAALLAAGSVVDAGDPTTTLSTPGFIGQYYFDTSANRLYVAEATSAPSDFTLVSASSGAITITGTGTGIAKGDAVAGPTGALVLADSDVEKQVVGIADGSLTSGGDVVIFGLVSGVDVTAFANEDILYVASAGTTGNTLTSTQPTTGFVYEVGTVVDGGGTGSGTILVNPKLYGSATVTNTDWVLAQAMSVPTTGGAAAEVVEYATSGFARSVLTFAQGVDEKAFIDIVLPNGWDNGTVSFVAYWSQAAGAGNVIWQFEGRGFSNGDDIDLASGTAVSVTDTGGTAETLYQTAATGNVTIAGSPTDGNLLTIEVTRNGANASDTLAASAYLHGFKLIWTRSALDDA